MLRSRSLLVACVVLASSCRAAPPTSAPPPTGQAYADYLRDDPPPPPVRPAGTDPDDVMALHFIDIGQGLAVLIELPCGAVLVDTGGEENERFQSEPRLLAYLDAFFARRGDLDATIDLLVITHPHIDHTRSIAAVLGRYRVRNVIDNGDVREDLGGTPQLEMHAWIARQDGQVGHRDIAVDEIGPDGLTDEVIDPIGGCERSPTDPAIRALWGGRLGREELGENPNDHSVVLRLDFGAASALITGDIEQLAIARITEKYRDNLAILDTDVYQVPHHGSRKSTAEHFIAAVRPKVAVISAGPYERHLKTDPEYTARAFGHPNLGLVEDLMHPEHGVSLQRPSPVDVMLGIRGAWKGTPSEWVRRTLSHAIYTTGWDGTVVVHAYGSGWIEVVTERRR
jgi:competence protein ComEC